MSELEFYYHIRASLPPKPETPASLGAKFLQTLDALSRIDPAIFTNWQVMDLPAMAPFPIEEVRPYIAGIIETNVARDDWDNPTPEWGYTADAYTGDVVASRFIGLRIRAGGKDRGEISLESGNFKVFPDPAIVTYPVFKAALLALNSSWPPAWACAYAFSMDYDRTPLHPAEPLFPYSNFHIPWLAYLSAPLVADLIVPPDIVIERTPDAGYLLIASEQRLDPSDMEHLRRARVLAEILIERTGYQRGGTTSI